MLALPKRFLKFFFSSSLGFFARMWIHTISVIEEDLAVGLMFRLLFVPLFHDSSIVGRILSLLFRVTRIALGIVAYALASFLILMGVLVWFFGWTLICVPAVKIWGFVYVGFVVSLFIDRVVFYPSKTVGSLKRKGTKPVGVIDVWKTTKLTSKDLLWQPLLQKTEVKSLLETLEITPEVLRGYNPILNNDSILKALVLGQKIGAKYLTPDYFFVSLLQSISGIENDLLKLNLGIDDFIEALSFQEQKRVRKTHVYIWDSEFGVKHLKGVNRGWLGAPTPWLDSVSIDLTREAARVGFDEFLGRKDVLLEVINILSQSKGRNVLLVGPAGTGKSSLVNYMAKVIVAGDAPESFATKRLVSLDLSRLLAGVTSQGELATKIKNVFDEVRSVGGIIIYIDEIQNLGIGEAGNSFNLYSLLLPEIESSGTQFLASTEPENFARILERDASFARLFTKVEVPPATLSDTIGILKNRALDMEQWDGISITFKAIKELANLSHDLIHDRVLPDSALANLEECKVSAKNGLVTSGVVKSVIQKRVNIPVGEVTGAQKDELLNLENLIHERMVDQVEAVNVIANTLRRSATALREKNRPIGSFLFVGPTGVGKTELAKILSETYFKNTAAFTRFDMSEYQTEEAVNRLLGTVENPGELTEAVKNKPYSLILLDEFEKADPKILTLFLQVLDDGRLTDARGVTVDFTNTIIIATSNAASLLIAQSLGQGISMDALKESVKGELLKTFKPELVNRFDEVVIFKPLSQEDLEKIVMIKLKGLKGLMKEKGYLIDFSPELIAELARKGFDPILGARPLRRFIQDSLEAKLSRMMLENKLVKGQNFLAGRELLT